MNNDDRITPIQQSAGSLDAVALAAADMLVRNSPSDPNFLAGAHLVAADFQRALAGKQISREDVGAIAINMQLLAEKVARLYASPDTSLATQTALAKCAEQRDKFMWQVRDTCKRAELAEDDTARAVLEREQLREQGRTVTAQLAEALTALRRMLDDYDDRMGDGDAAAAAEARAILAKYAPEVQP